jgi:hypothetical protein
MTRLMMPNDGPSYSVVDQVRWDCPRERLPEVVTVLEGAFRSAPGGKLAEALFRLRIMTRAREQKSEEMMEAEATIWVEQLRTYPGDIALDVLKTWTTRPNGQWWPTWHEVQAELQKRSDRRQSLLNFVRQLSERPSPVVAITDQPPTAEQRAKAVEHYEQNIRPELKAWHDEIARQKAQETPEQALERLSAKTGEPFAIGGDLLKKLEAMKQGA